jgi:hypothetical protein
MRARLKAFDHIGFSTNTPPVACVALKRFSFPWMKFCSLPTRGQTTDSLSLSRTMRPWSSSYDMMR